MVKVCKDCLFDSSVSGVTISDNGICSICKISNQFSDSYPSGDKGKEILASKIEEIKKDGKGKKYDCVIGVSGGGDSSYLLHLFKVEFGLRILAVHFDNTWNTTIATTNIHKMCTALDIDLYTHVVDAKEFDDLTLSFFKSGLRDIEVPTDIGFASVINNAAIKHNVKWRIDGHNFRTEGIGPIDWVYIDGKYMLDVYKKHGGNLKLKSIPKLTLLEQLYMWIFKRTKLLRPFYYLDISKEDTRDFLEKEYGWRYYGGHHLENIHTCFFHQYYFPKKWGINTRIVEHSALMRMGLIGREEANKISQLESEQDTTHLIKYYKKRHNLTDAEFNNYMNTPANSHVNYKTYKKTFETMRPFFWLLLKKELISQSFYEKYCLKK